MSKGRIISFVLYPDHDPSMKFLNFALQYRTSAFILHDKDKNEDGTEKIPHYHCMILFPNPVEAGRLGEDGKHSGYCKIISDSVGRTVEVKPYTSISESLMYFIHEDFSSLFDENKYHYSIEDVKGSYAILKHYKKSSLDDEEILLTLEKFAIENDWNLKEVWRWCITNMSSHPELFHIFTKYQNQIKNICESNLQSNNWAFANEIINRNKLL